MGLAGRATYNFTPAPSLYGVVHGLWGAQAVDTDTASQLASAGTGTPARRTVSQNSFVQGDDSHLGTEAICITWRFSPNTAFDLVGGYFFALRRGRVRTGL